MWSTPHPKPKPTIVFVPGGWHSPSAYDALLPLLHRAGYPTTYVYLPSVGAAAPVTFEDDVAAVRRVVAGLVKLGREVVLVSHSYGAAPATEAVKGLTRDDRKKEKLGGGVAQLVYIAAIVPTKGASSYEAFGPFTPREEGGSWMVIKDLGDGFTAIDNPGECFYHDLEPEIAEYHASLLQGHCSVAGAGALTYPAYHDVSAAYIYCEDDRAFPLDRQQRIVRDTAIKRTVSLKTSHSPFLSQPDRVVMFIREVVE
ncbi:Alpha/beta hydrolase fold-1 [Aspergillus karnatakaensis]|uniref:alpha/beta hydrolase n=1 Tax=Aspergillus karnatakaensis TaxID=1810916 RepID=UPI003CCCDDA1